MDQLNILKIRKPSVNYTYSVDIIKQEIEADKLGSDNIDEDKVNPYHKIITNKVKKGI